MAVEANTEEFSVNTGEADSQDQGESFAELIEKSGPFPERLSPGRKIKSRVIGVSGDHVYIDLGGKTDGIIDLEELKDETGSLTVKEGDEIEAFFVTVEDGAKKFTTRVNGYPAAKLNTIRSAHEAGLPVKGEVKREVKGGFEVSVGGVRCFCPFSQIDLKGGREGGIYLGQILSFKVIEFAEEGKNIIVSRRVLLEQEREEKIARLKETLSVGMDVTGTIRSVQRFGAFVDLGGVDALIPASEISWERVGKVEDVLSVGQSVNAKIISLDWENNRLTLSMKASQPDPWATAHEKYPVESRVSGVIVRLAPFGAFVNLEPGVDGLIHVSNLGAGRRINHPKEAVEVGQQVEAYVLAVDPVARKLSLSMRPKRKEEKIILPSVGEAFEWVVEKVMPYGIFVKNANGLTGLIPNVEMGTPRGADHSGMFPPGSPVQAVVIEVDKEKGKVRLSRKAALEKTEREEFKQYADSSKGEEKPAPSFNTLGEILKARMEEKTRGE